MPPTADLQIAYDGTSVSTGEMDIRDLAPALLAVSDLFNEANDLANGDQTVIGVYVKAVERGSFLLHLSLDLDTIKDAAGSLFSADLKNAEALVALVFGGHGLIGLFKLIKKLRGKPIETTRSQILRDGNTVIDFTDANLSHSQITITPLERRLYESPFARKAAEKTVKPVEQAGIDRFFVRDRDVLIEEVTHDDIESFKILQSGVASSLDVSESERTATFEIVTASFTDRYQWRLTDGNMTMTARIEDPWFLERIESGERFGKGDLIRVKLLQRQWRDQSGLHADYKILGVLEVIPAPIQRKLV